jgi:hypothetical protein
MRRFLVASLPLVIAFSACASSTQAERPEAGVVAAGDVSAGALVGSQLIPVSKDSCCTLAVDSLLNRIYIGRTANAAGSNTTVVDGSTFKIITTIKGFGGAHNVDSKTHRFWLPGLSAGNVKVYSGRTNSAITTVTLSACPTDSWIDATHRTAWIAAQCGNGNDPVWAVNAGTYEKVSGKIGTGGNMGATVVNPVTGKFYLNNSSGNFEIAPGTFAMSQTAFGIAYAVNSRANLIYAAAKPGTLNIVDGNSDQVVRSFPLFKAPTAIAVNARLDHVYLTYNKNFIEVLDGSSGSERGSISFQRDYVVKTVASDGRRGRIYAGIAAPNRGFLFEITDNTPAR